MKSEDSNTVSQLDARRTLVAAQVSAEIQEGQAVVAPRSPKLDPEQSAAPPGSGTDDNI